MRRTCHATHASANADHDNRSNRNHDYNHDSTTTEDCDHLHNNDSGRPYDHTTVIVDWTKLCIEQCDQRNDRIHNTYPSHSKRLQKDARYKGNLGQIAPGENSKVSLSKLTNTSNRDVDANDWNGTFHNNTKNDDRDRQDDGNNRNNDNKYGDTDSERDKEKRYHTQKGKTWSIEIREPVYVLDYPITIVTNDTATTANERNNKHRREK